MSIKISFLQKYFWILTYLVYLLTALFSYGFIKDLYFFKEDYGDIYYLLFGGNQGFPYHGIKYILYPFYLVFGDKPAGYFQVAFFLYTLLSLFLTFFIWKYTKNKLVAFISGLLFAAGYVGSETMFMVELALPEIIYLFALFGVLISYKNYIDFHSVTSWLVAFCLFTLSILLISQRAHSFLFLVFLADFYLTWKQKIFKVTYLISSIKRVLPFFLSFVIVYTGLPFLYTGKLVIHTLNANQAFNINSYLAFLSDLGNYLVPYLFQERLAELLQNLNYNLIASSIIATLFFVFILVYLYLNSFLTKSRKFLYAYGALFLLNSLLLVPFANKRVDLFLSSFIGLFLLYLIFGVIFFIKLGKENSKFLTFLTLSWIASYIVFHMREPVWVHDSTSRYLTSGFPFFTSIVAIILLEVFIKLHSTKKLKVVGYLLIFVLFSSYVAVSSVSPLKQSFLERSYHLKNFISSLKNTIPQLYEGKSLFYFDVTRDTATMNLFATFLSTGSFPEEIVLAGFYKTKMEQVQLVRDYDSFIEEKNKGLYKNHFVLYYDVNKKLNNLTPYFKSNTNHNSLTIDDFSKIKIGLYNNLLESNVVEVKDGKVLYQTIIHQTSEGSFAKNDILELKIEDFNFPSYKSIRLDITLSSNDLTSTIESYPYKDGSLSELPKEYYLSDLYQANTLKSILNYIDERNNFKESASVLSGESEPPFKIKNIIDGNVETSWYPKRQPFVKGGPAWVEFILPENYTFSEVRWVSSEPRWPTSYEYQISDLKDGQWKTIASIKQSNAKMSEYVVDKIPPTTIKHFRMLISKSNANFPAISELELIKTQTNVHSEQANFILKHPLAYSLNKSQTEQLITSMQNSLLLGIYPITDKLMHKNYVLPIKKYIRVDGEEHTYSFTLPPAGTKLISLLLEFPNVPISTQIQKVVLTQVNF